ncbi:hypothetical protein [Chromobacterium amazonense]|uniref:hypothetical protein n=1 Tax=Chromobacterium amazonense TaxID=1382803 RepID=UPI001470F90D|nr:hypothetical protein [Chromobacterium amazonense]
MATIEQRSGKRRAKVRKGKLPMPKCRGQRVAFPFPPSARTDERLTALESDGGMSSRH